MAIKLYNSFGALYAVDWITSLICDITNGKEEPTNAQITKIFKIISDEYCDFGSWGSGWDITQKIIEEWEKIRNGTDE